MQLAEEDAREGGVNGSNDKDYYNNKRYIDEIDNSSSKKAKKIKLEAFETDDENNFGDLVIDEKNNYLEENPEKNHFVENVELNKNEEITKNGSNLSKSPELYSTKKGLNTDEKEEKKINLEKGIADLGNLLKLNEEEWNLMLRLKKMKEILLEHLRRVVEISLQTSSVEAINCGFSQLPTTSTRTTTQNQNDKNDNSRISGEGENIRLNIEKIKREINELEFQLKQHDLQKDSFFKKSPVNDLAKKGDFKESLALQQLNERNKTSQTQEILPLNATSSSSFISNKVIGERRQDNNVEVRSIIAEYRSKNYDETDEINNGGKKVVKKSQPNPLLIQPLNISYKDILLSFAERSKRENSRRNSQVVSGGINKRNQNTSNPTKANHRASTKRHVRSFPSKDDVSDPLCQGCNRNSAEYVCSGCNSQWYCSRKCQVAAWDEHSEICTG